MRLEKKNIELVKQIIEDKGITDLNVISDTGETPLNYSVKYGTPEIVEYLIDNGLCDINQVEDSPTPLMVACAYQNQEMVKLLIEKGPDLELKDDDGDTALLIAALFNDLSIVENLIDAGANIDAQNNDRQTVDNILNHNLEIDHRGRERILIKLLHLRLLKSNTPYEIPLGGGKKRRKTIKQSKRKNKSKRKKKSKRKYK